MGVVRYALGAVGGFGIRGAFGAPGALFSFEYWEKSALQNGQAFKSSPGAILMGFPHSGHFMGSELASAGLKHIEALPPWSSV